MVTRLLSLWYATSCDVVAGELVIAIVAKHSSLAYAGEMSAIVLQNKSAAVGSRLGRPAAAGPQ